MARDTTIRADSSGGRGCSDPSDHCPGSELRAIWLPEDHSRCCGVRAGKWGKDRGAADLAAGGAESAAKTKAARTAVAERRFLCTTEAERPNHVWSYDFMSARTHEGRTLRLLTLLDEYTRECLAIRVERRMGSQQIIEALSDVMLWRGIPEQIPIRQWPRVHRQRTAPVVANLGTGTLYIEPGSPWENGYCESFNGKLRDECLNGGDLLLVEGGTGGD